MIVEYHRPQTLEQTFSLLARSNPLTIPLGGGSVINQPSTGTFAVVDLQRLHLNKIKGRGKTLEIGATVTLQELLDIEPAAGDRSMELPKALKLATGHEGTYNLRQVATVAGSLVSGNGRSPFLTALLALDTKLVIEPGDNQVRLGDFLPFREEKIRGKLITQITIPLNVWFSYHYIARSPADLHIVSAGVVVWSSGRTRIALGGYGAVPMVAFDGTETDGAVTAAVNAFSQANDQWASAEYRSAMAGLLTGRCIDDINKTRSHELEH